MGLRALAVWVIVLASATGARAEDRPPWRLRASGGGGIVVSTDQWEYLHLDRPAVQARVHFAWLPHELIALEASLSGGAFFSSGASVGGLLDLSLGAEIGIETGAVRPWLAAHFGAGVTGALVLPVLRISVGLDGIVSDEVSLGPALEYGHVFYEDGRGRTNDAQFFMFGLSFTYRPLAPVPPPPSRPRRRPRPPPPPAPIAPSEAPAASNDEILALIDDAAGLEPRELLVPVLFEFDSVEIVACSTASLHALREYLSAHGEIRVLEIEGHADGSGAPEYNDALSQRRAEAIRDWLVEHGVEPERLRVAARGELAPVERDEAEEAERQQNRRARFRVIEEGE
jgi:outer membrane protein OmpA-like peptidoglycan-associated protein